MIVEKNVWHQPFVNCFNSSQTCNNIKCLIYIDHSRIHQWTTDIKFKYIQFQLKFNSSMALIYSICQRFKTVQFNTKGWFPLKACWISIIMVYLRKLVVWTDTSNIEEEKPAEWKNFNSCQLSSKLISTVSTEKWLVYNLTVLSVLLLAW